jgi:DNA-binding MarR family transcriptional regulator
MYMDNMMEVQRVVSDFVRLYRFRCRDEACCSGLTVSELYALESLLYYGPLHATHLADMVGLDVSSTTRVVDHLIKKKLVVRRRSPEDARVREVEITESGRRILGHTDGPISALLSEAISSVSREEAESFVNFLKRLIGALNPEDIPAKFQHGCCSGLGAIHHINSMEEDRNHENA